MPRTRYTLALLAGALLVFPACDSNDDDGGGGGVSGPGALSDCRSIGSLTIGQTIDGALTLSDCSETRFLSSEYKADYYRFTLPSSTTLQFDMLSRETAYSFDTYLTVYDSGGSRVASNDDGGDDLNARLRTTLDAGAYYLSAGSFDPPAQEEGVGRYRLVSAVD